MRFLVLLATFFCLGLMNIGSCFANEAEKHEKNASHHPVRHPHHLPHHAHHPQGHGHMGGHTHKNQHEKHTHKNIHHAAAPIHKVSAVTETAETTEATPEAPHGHWIQNHWHNPHLIQRSMVFASNAGHSLVTLVHTAVSQLHHTAYRYGGNYFNMSQGVYEVDCSDYVDNLLRISQPKAYAALAGATHTVKPTSGDYYRFFNQLPDSDNSGYAWQRVDNVEALKAGDVLVFRNYRGGGHVMVVMDTPVPALNENDTYFVRVSDSAHSRHSNDTRPAHASGIGIGTLMLKADPQTGQPSAYAWTIDSGWDHANVAMASPISEA